MWQIIIDAPLVPIDSPYDCVTGWVRHPAGAGKHLSLAVNGRDTPAAWFERADLDPRFGTGFTFFFNAEDIPGEGPGPVLNLEVTFDHVVVTSHSLSIVESAYSGLEELRTAREAKRQFLAQTVRIPLSVLEGCKALTGLPSDWPISPRLDQKSDAVSAHAYDADIRRFISANAANGYVLDAGAGLRKRPLPNVITTEIYDYPSTDVLAIGQELPFDDGVFEAALSFAVLEHVDDPFVCAKELIRVVRPGGRIYCIIPFLQAEHGYPSHFFNATRFGMRKLFEACVVEKQWLNASNHPIFTVHQVLGTYLAGLEPSARPAFASLTVQNLIEIGAQAHAGGTSSFMNVSEDVAWQIAWGTTAIFRKPSNPRA